jgi:ribosomal protein S18 acetylase RimI-like enzyme
MLAFALAAARQILGGYRAVAGPGVIARGLRTAALDVAVGNPRAQALYERLGFVVAAERVSTLRNAQATVANHRRMELPLAPRA